MRQVTNEIGQLVTLDDNDQPVVQPEDKPVWWNDRWHHPGVSPNSVASRIRPYKWDQERLIRFEVARDVLNSEFSACTGRIYREKDETEPDQTIITKCEDRQQEISKLRKSLEIDDDAAVEKILVGAKDRIEQWRNL